MDDDAELERAGLNLRAVFDLDRLPAPIRTQLRQHCPGEHHRQVLLLGHGGRALWSAVAAAGIASADPIDDFSESVFRRWFARRFPGHRCTVLYPGGGTIPLQRLGALAGWHHPSPLGVGINGQWGTWFAYRVAALTDTGLAATPPLAGPSPCAGCPGQPCRAACPAGAVDGSALDVGRCIGYRRQAESRCRHTCLARCACPVVAAQRYEAAQMRHSYGHSLAMIDRGDQSKSGRQKKRQPKLPFF